MTPEQQRIAIAEACGFTKDWDFKRAQPCRGWCAESLPDYLNDLNAMHEAESVMDFHHDQRWIENLVQIGLRESALTLDRTDGWDWALVCARSTAAQRAEAFLKTLNIWNQ